MTAVLFSSEAEKPLSAVLFPSNVPYIVSKASILSKRNARQNRQKKRKNRTKTSHSKPPYALKPRFSCAE